MVQVYGSGISNTENVAMVSDNQEVFVRHPGSVETFGTSVTTGSESFLYGISGGDWYPIAVESGTEAILRTTASVTTGSETFPFGKSGADFYQLLSTSGTDGGILRVEGTFTAGSESVITAGSVEVYDGGNSITVDGTVSTGSESFNHGKSGTGWIALKVNSDGTLNTTVGSESIITAGSVEVFQGTSTKLNATIGNFGDLGSTRVIDSPETIGSLSNYTVDLGANNDVTIDNSSIVHAEDSVHNTGDDGIMTLVVRNDTPGTLVGANGDYTPLQVGSTGALFSHDIVLDDVIGIVGSPAPSSVMVIGAEDSAGNIRQPLILNTNFDDQPATDLALLTTNRNFVYDGTTWDRQRGDSTNGTLVNLGANNDVTITTNPVPISGIVNQGTTPWTVSGTSNVSGNVGILGSVQNFSISRADSVQNTTSLISTTFTSILTAAGAGSFHDLTSLDITNESSSSNKIEIFDESGTAVSAILTYALSPKGGLVKNWSEELPLKQTGAGSDWYAQLDSTGSVHLNIQARKRI